MFQIKQEIELKLKEKTIPYLRYEAKLNGIKSNLKKDEIITALLTMNMGEKVDSRFLKKTNIPNEETLRNQMKIPQLRILAKSCGIKANLKKDDIISALLNRKMGKIVDTKCLKKTR